MQRCCCSACRTTPSAGVHTVLVHPTTVVLSGEHSQVAGIVSDGPMPILGQADLHGPVLIVWDAVLAEARHPGSGHNVVFHEFAHRLDMLTGDADGTPPMSGAEQAERWVQVCTDVYEQVVEGRGGTVLRSYAGVNPAEFFAVATEAFFDAPVPLRHEHPDLYEVLRATTARTPPPAGADRPRPSAPDATRPGLLPGPRRFVS